MSVRHEIADHRFLRYLADVLQARDVKVVPNNVDADSWIPVIPYPLEYNCRDYYKVSFSKEISGSVAVFSAGPEDIDVQFDEFLPPGFIYEIIGGAIIITTGAAPALGDYLAIRGNIDYSNGDFPQIFDSSIQNGGGALLGPTAQEYRFDLNNFVTASPKNGEPIIHNTFKGLELDVYTRSNGMGISFSFLSFDSGGSGKVFPAGSTGALTIFFRRRALQCLEITPITPG